MLYSYKLVFDSDDHNWSIDPDPDLSPEENIAALKLLPYVLATILRDELSPKAEAFSVSNEAVEKIKQAAAEADKRALEMGGRRRPDPDLLRSQGETGGCSHDWEVIKPEFLSNTPLGHRGRVIPHEWCKLCGALHHNFLGIKEPKEGH